MATNGITQLSLVEAERAHLKKVLRAVGGHRTKAASVLGISRKVLWEKLKDYGIEWARAGGYFSPFRGVAASNYPGRAEQFATTAMETAGAIIPDASDSMPTAVGSASYWKGLSLLANPKTPLKKAIATMEGGWAAVAKTPTPGSSAP